MENDEILFRLLQVSSALSTLMLLIVCMQMQRVAWWLRIPTYLLMLSTAVTLMTTFFIRQYTIGMVVVTLAVLSVTATALALHMYIRPIPKDKREAINRRIFWWGIPTFAIFLGCWIMAGVFDGGANFFARMEHNQSVIIKEQKAVRTELKAKNKSDRLRDSVLVADAEATQQYRGKLDSRLDVIERQLDNHTSQLDKQAMQMQRMNLQNQKNWRPPY